MRKAPRSFRRLVLGLAIMVVAGFGTLAYLPQQRADGDGLLAIHATEGLRMAELGVSHGGGALRAVDGASVVAWLFLDSDSADRVPLSHLERALLALRTWDDLTIRAEEGERSPRVGSLAFGEEAIAAFPEVDRFVVEIGGVRRFDNEDSGLLALLEEKRMAETEAAVREVELLYPSFSFPDILADTEGTDARP